MSSGNAVLAVQRGCNWNLQRLDQTHQFRRGAGRPYATACDNHRPFRSLQQIKHRADMRFFRLRSKWRDACKHLLDQRLHLGLLGVDLAFIAAELEMHRAWATADCRTERLP